MNMFTVDYQPSRAFPLELEANGRNLPWGPQRFPVPLGRWRSQWSGDSHGTALHGEAEDLHAVQVDFIRNLRRFNEIYRDFMELTWNLRFLLGFIGISHGIDCESNANWMGFDGTFMGLNQEKGWFHLDEWMNLAWRHWNSSEARIGDIQHGHQFKTLGFNMFLITGAELVLGWDLYQEMLRIENKESQMGIANIQSADLATQKTSKMRILHDLIGAELGV